MFFTFRRDIIFDEDTAPNTIDIKVNTFNNLSDEDLSKSLSNRVKSLLAVKNVKFYIFNILVTNNKINTEWL